jgi:type I restriction enzyme M protein
MALKKSQLYSSLWQSCDELRGGMDASQYKDYILTLLFMKYVTDKYAGDPYALIEIPEGGSFADMVRLKGDKEIGDKINKIIGRLAEANELKGVIDQADFNDESKLGSGKEMQDRLSKLVAIFAALDFRANRAAGDDLLGDAYEYLMRNFATESGKSKGQFYTPAEVSRVMAKVVGIGPDTRPDQTIYDPTGGSGSLLLKAADEAPGGITIYGQEMDSATWALARMNMILHGHPTAEIWRGNTLADPYFKQADGSLMTFDFGVANFPFSQKNWTSGVDPEHDEFKRFDGFGVPPAKNGDYAFMLHLIKSLKSTGKAAIILPHGVLFRGNKEADIRRNLIRRGLIKGIIGLPPNLFYGTGIPACIIVVDKEGAPARTGIFMVDASKGFLKDGNKNRLRAQDIHKIVDVFNRQHDLPGYARLVPFAEIADPANSYNLNIPRYIDGSEAGDLHDLDAHLNGGIPLADIDALDAYWTVFPSLRSTLFRQWTMENGELPMENGQLTVDNGELTVENGRPSTKLSILHSPFSIKETILEHAEFKAYAGRVAAVFGGWRQAHTATLKDLRPGSKPKDVIHTLAEDLLLRFADVPLLDRYDVYQQLMDYWDETMQDDVDMIATDGWVDAARPRPVIEDKDKKIKETPDLTIGRAKYKMDLIPPSLIVARYFVAEQIAIEALQVAHEAAAQRLAEFIEEQTGEEGLLEEATNDKGNVSKGGVKERIRQLRIENGQLTAAEDAAELAALEACLVLMDAEAEAARAVKDAQAELDKQVLAQYGDLSEEEIKRLVVDDKWFAAVQIAVDDQLQRMTQRLAGRVKELEERYAESLPVLEIAVADLKLKVDSHLKRMGVIEL